MTTSTSIGFIGVGRMGSRMAMRLAAAGFAVTACDRDPRALEPLATRGLATTTRVADCASADVVCAIVTTDEQLTDAMLGPDGIEGGLAEGAAPLVVLMSTVLPATIRRIGAALDGRGARVLDAPVSGGTVGAADGSLAILVGGARADFDAVRPVLVALGRTVVHCGALGAGTVAKIVNNMVGVTNLFLAAEAYQLALRNGLDLATLAPALDAGSGRSLMTADIATTRARYGDLVNEPGAFDGLAAIVRKDLALAQDLARESGLPLPFLDAAAGALRSIDHATFERWAEVAAER